MPLIIPIRLDLTGLHEAVKLRDGQLSERRHSRADLLEVLGVHCLVSLSAISMPRTGDGLQKNTILSYMRQWLLTVSRGFENTLRSSARAELYSGVAHTGYF